MPAWRRCPRSGPTPGRSFRKSAYRKREEKLKSTRAPSGAEIIEAARTFLFVPGDRPDRFEKALASGADVVILDLEDAVAAGVKASAREAVAAWLGADRTAVVRINGSGTEWFEEDLTLARKAGLLGLMLPKSEPGDDLARVARQAPVIALIESARGVVGVEKVAANDGVRRLAYGTIDLALDIEVEDETAIAVIGSRLVVASRANDLPPPIDGVTRDFRDFAVVEYAMRAGRKRGFGAKLCIHPAQIPPVRRAFSPSEEELERAKRIVAADTASHGAAVALDGQMVDRPVVARAYRVLADAGLR